MLLGLPIEGKKVNGVTNLSNSIYKELLGAHILCDTLRGQGVLLTRLTNHYRGMILTEKFNKRTKNN